MNILLLNGFEALKQALFSEFIYADAWA